MSIFAISCTFNFVDAKNKTSTTKVRIPVGLTIATITAFAQAAAQLFVDFSSCRLTSVKACVGIDISGLGLQTVAAAQADVAEKGYFGLRTAGNTYGKMILPTFAESLVAPNSDAIDTTDTDVAAFITALEDGIATTGGTIAPVDLRDNDFVEVTEARELFRKFTPSS